MKKTILLFIFILSILTIKAQEAYQKYKPLKYEEYLGTIQSYRSVISHLSLDSTTCAFNVMNSFFTGVAAFTGNVILKTDNGPVVKVANWSVFYTNYLLAQDSVLALYRQIKWSDTVSGSSGKIMTRFYAQSSILAIQDSLNTKISNNGTIYQYIRGNGSKATFPTNVSSFTNDAAYLTSITNTQIVIALGFTPYSNTNPNGYIANLSSLSTSNLVEGSNLYYTSARFNTAFSAKNTDNLTEGSTNLYFTNTRARSAISLSNTSTTGVSRYDNSTGIITIPVDSTINYSPGRSLVSVAAAANGFQISTTRPVDVYYSGSVTCATTIGVVASVEGYISLEICSTNSSTASDWKEVGRISNGSTIGVALALALTDKNGSQLNFKVPKGYYIRLRTTNVAGTPTYALTTQIEQLTN